VRDLFRPLFALYQDDETRTYFINVKNGNDPIKARKLIHDGIVSLDDPVKAEEIAVRVRAKLGLFESLLAETASRGPFVRGDTASHADLALWGWYVSSQVNPNVNALLWHHESLPNVKLWAEATANATRFVSPFEYVSEERKQEVLEELLAGVDAARA
jgi:glutathione S-transferase